MSYNPRNYTIPNFQKRKLRREATLSSPSPKQTAGTEGSLILSFVFSPEKQSAYIFLE